MRNVYFALVATLATTCLISCHKQQTNLPEDYLYHEMVNYSQHFSSVFQDVNNYQTKSDIHICCDTDVDDLYISFLDRKFIDYIDLYTLPESIDQWNEYSILRRINQDSDFNDEDKLVIARSLSFAYYVKNTSEFTITKAVTAEDCYKEYQKASHRALRRALLTLAVGLSEPTLAGESLAVGMYLLDMMDAKEDYNDCLARVNYGA